MKVSSYVTMEAARLMLRTALLAVKRDMPGCAESIFVVLERVHPELRMTHALHGLSLCLMGRQDEGRQMLESLADARSDDWLAKGLLAMVLDLQGDARAGQLAQRVMASDADQDIKALISALTGDIAPVVRKHPSATGGLTYISG